MLPKKWFASPVSGKSEKQRQSGPVRQSWVPPTRPDFATGPDYGIRARSFSGRGGRSYAGRASAPGEIRVPLLEEGAGALGEVLGGGQRLLRRHLLLERERQGGLGRGVHDPFGQADRLGRRG